jgi:arsenite methyltransferase
MSDPSRHDAIRDEVRDYYTNAAHQGRDGYGDTGVWGASRYPQSDRSAAPAAAVELSMGCGNPYEMADLEPGETILDLGSGGGLDVILSARRVGPTGHAYGIDFLDDMIHLARTHAAEAGVDNVEFLKGDIEHVPLPDAAVDVIISNCVICLAPDKTPVFDEIARLKPGGGWRSQTSSPTTATSHPMTIRHGPNAEPAHSNTISSSRY